MSPQTRWPIPALSTDRPIFLAEVLSPSSETRDFVEKLEEYTAIASLQTYVIFAG